MKIHLIRHGMTIANEKKLYCGSTDLPLSKKGIESLKSLKNDVAFPMADKFVATGLMRTVMTTQTLYDREPDIILPEWNEFNFGTFEMKSYEQLKDNLAYIDWISGIDKISCPNGENRTIFLQRVKIGLEIIKAMDCKSIVVICHGGVIASVMEIMFPDEQNFYEWQPTYGRGYTIEFAKPFKTYLKSI